jgi:hypothetical protein
MGRSPKQQDAAANKGTDLPGICGPAAEPARPQMLTEKYFFSEPSAVPGLSNLEGKAIGAGTATPEPLNIQALRT